MAKINMLKATLKIHKGFVQEAHKSKKSREETNKIFKKGFKSNL